MARPELAQPYVAPRHRRRRRSPRSTCTRTPRPTGAATTRCPRSSAPAPTSTSASTAAARRRSTSSRRTTASARWPRSCSPSTPRPRSGTPGSPTRRSSRARAATPTCSSRSPASTPPRARPASPRPAGWSRSSACAASSSTRACRRSTRTTGRPTRSTRCSRSWASRRCSTPARPGSGRGLPGGGGIRLKYSNPMHLDDVAVDFPDLTIIIAHPSFPWQDEALAVASHKPQVYIDLSGWSPKYFPPQLVQYANTPAQAQGAVRLGLPADHAGPLAGRLRETGHQGRGAAADPQGERRSPRSACRDRGTEGERRHERSRHRQLAGPAGADEPRRRSRWPPTTSR